MLKTGCNTTAGVAYSEVDGAQAIAIQAKNKLLAYGYTVYVGYDWPGENIKNSNSVGANLHIPIHSNAGAWDFSSLNPASGGTHTFHCNNIGTNCNSTRQSQSKALGTRLRERMTSPGTSDKQCSDNNTSCTPLTRLGELYTNAVPAYVEAEFHTYGIGVTSYLQKPGTVGSEIANGVDAHLGFPRPPTFRSPGVIS